MFAQDSEQISDALSELKRIIQKREDAYKAGVPFVVPATGAQHQHALPTGPPSASTSATPTPAGTPMGTRIEPLTTREKGMRRLRNVRLFGGKGPRREDHQRPPLHTRVSHGALPSPGAGDSDWALIEEPEETDEAVTPTTDEHSAHGGGGSDRRPSTATPRRLQKPHARRRSHSEPPLVPDGLGRMPLPGEAGDHTESDEDDDDDEDRQSSSSARSHEWARHHRPTVQQQQTGLRPAPRPQSQEAQPPRPPPPITYIPPGSTALQKYEHASSQRALSPNNPFLRQQPRPADEPPSTWSDELYAEQQETLSRSYGQMSLDHTPYPLPRPTIGHVGHVGHVPEGVPLRPAPLPPPNAVDGLPPPSGALLQRRASRLTTMHQGQQGYYTPAPSPYAQASAPLPAFTTPSAWGTHAFGSWLPAPSSSSPTDEQQALSSNNLRRGSRGPLPAPPFPAASAVPANAAVYPTGPAPPVPPPLSQLPASAARQGSVPPPRPPPLDTQSLSSAPPYAAAPSPTAPLASPLSAATTSSSLQRRRTSSLAALPLPAYGSRRPSAIRASERRINNSDGLDGHRKASLASLVGGTTAAADEQRDRELELACPETEGGQPLRPVDIPAQLVGFFVKSAGSNTSKGIETCGLLLGTLVRACLPFSALPHALRL